MYNNDDVFVGSCGSLNKLVVIVLWVKVVVVVSVVFDSDVFFIRIGSDDNNNSISVRYNVWYIVGVVSVVEVDLCVIGLSMSLESIVWGYEIGVVDVVWILVYVKGVNIVVFVNIGVDFLGIVDGVGVYDSNFFWFGKW